MTQFLEKYQAYIAKIRAHGHPLASFECPACTQILETERPYLDGNEKWDSWGTCPYCESIFFKVVPAHGPVEIKLIEDRSHVH